MYWCWQARDELLVFTQHVEIVIFDLGRLGDHLSRGRAGASGPG
jgi:hypothetical protein